MGNKINKQKCITKTTHITEPAHFLDLPCDLKKKICEYAGRSSWPALTRTCKKWNDFFNRKNSPCLAFPLKTYLGTLIDEFCPYAVYKVLNSLTLIMGTRITNYLHFLKKEVFKNQPIQLSKQVANVCNFIESEGMTFYSFHYWITEFPTGIMKKGSRLKYGLFVTVDKPPIETLVVALVFNNDSRQYESIKQSQPKMAYWDWKDSPYATDHDIDQQYLVLGFVYVPIILGFNTTKLIIIFRVQLTNYTEPYGPNSKYEFKPAGICEAHCIYNDEKSKIKRIEQDETLEEIIIYFYRKAYLSYWKKENLSIYRDILNRPVTYKVNFVGDTFYGSAPLTKR